MSALGRPFGRGRFKRGGGSWHANKKYTFADKDDVLDYYNEPEEIPTLDASKRSIHVPRLQDIPASEDACDLDLDLDCVREKEKIEHSLLDDTHLLLDMSHLDGMEDLGENLPELFDPVHFAVDGKQMMREISFTSPFFRAAAQRPRT
jgi:hypothetical protein